MAVSGVPDAGEHLLVDQTPPTGRRKPARVPPGAPGQRVLDGDPALLVAEGIDVPYGRVDVRVFAHDDGDIEETLVPPADEVEREADVAPLSGPRPSAS